MKEYLIKVDGEISNKKIENALKQKLNLSDNIIKKIKYGCIYLNDKLVTNINNRVELGDLIKIVLPPDEPCEFTSINNYPIKVVYEDEYILAVLKPRGMLTHNSKGNSMPALDGAVMNYINQPFTFRAINRLDRDTSGIVLIAKDMISACAFGELMKKGKITKKYQALIVGEPIKNSFIIEAPIDRESPTSMKRVVSENGKYAKTECISIKGLNNGLSVAKILLHTGRTHQIRVHFAHAGYPLFADSLYGNAVCGKTYSLHAGEIEFTHPFTNEKLLLTAEIELENAT